MTADQASRPHDLLDETIHQRARLAIMATLGGVEELSFAELKAWVGLTDGNLGSHLALLEKSGYVQVTKAFVGKKPRTTVAMTEAGRQEMNRYLSLLQGILGWGPKQPRNKERRER